MRIKDFILVCITTVIMFPMTTLKAQNMETLIPQHYN